MNETLDVGGYALAIGEVGVTVMMFLQWIKKFPWWKNDWCEKVAPFLGLILSLGAIAAAGKITVDSIDGVATFNAILGGFTSGMAAVVGYHVQKPVGILKPGPDNHPDDKPKEKPILKPINSRFRSQRVSH